MSDEKELNTSGEQVSFKDIWAVPGFEKRCREILTEDKETTEDKFEELCGTINTEFEKKLPEGLRLSPEILGEYLPKLVWTKSVLDKLKQFVKYDLSLDKFREYYPYFSKPSLEKIFNEKVKFLTGIQDVKSSSKFVSGMGRLSTEDLPDDAENYEFPENDSSNPYVFESAREDWAFMNINGSSIGIQFDRLIAENPTRRALSEAEKRKLPFVVLTNPIDLDNTKTAGPTKVYRAQVSGIRVNSELQPEFYQEETKRILEDDPADEVIVQTPETKFNELLAGLYTISHRPDGSPEFTGQVLWLLGVKEEALINSYAYSEVRAIIMRKQKQLEVEIKLAKDELIQAEKHGTEEEIEECQRELDILVNIRAMMILSNVADRYYEKHRRRIRCLVVRKIERTIPNCKVLSQGSAFLRINGKSIKMHISSNAQVTDSLLARYSYGLEVFTDTLADLTVICAPHSLNHRSVGREDSIDGKPVTKFICVAPICIDGKFMRKKLKDTTRAVHPVHSVVFDPQFRSGVLLISSTNGRIDTESLPLGQLDSTPNIADVTNFAFPNPAVKYYNMFVHTDDHHGSRSKRRIWDPRQRMHLGVTEATIEIMRVEGIINPQDVRVHFTMQMDDPTQGNHFGTHNQPDPKEMSIIQIERLLHQMTDDILRAAEKADTELVKKLTDDLNQFSISQFYIRGLDWMLPQILEVFDRQIEPNLDFFDAVLANFESSKIRIKGISEINGIRFDSRDLGVHNTATGNHCLRTLENKMAEADLYARQLRALLGGLPRWQGKAGFIEKSVVAPRYSNETFGWGTIQAPGHFEWAVRMHSSPARLSSWNDTLQAVIKNDLNRGDDTYGLLKYHTLTLYGDKHFYCDAETERIFYVMCAAGTHTDLYGTRGFPPNNTGVMFVCLPADGPEAGPIVRRKLPHDFLRDWFANPKPFDWKKFLPEPV